MFSKRCSLAVSAVRIGEAPGLVDLVLKGDRTCFRSRSVGDARNLVDGVHSIMAVLVLPRSSDLLVPLHRGGSGWVHSSAVSATSTSCGVHVDGLGWTKRTSAIAR